MQLEIGNQRTGSRRSERGQSILLITVALTVVCGVLGLAVDIGYAYYLRQCAKAAAESAAMAAAEAALKYSQPGSEIACGSNHIVCNTSATACSNPPTSPAVNNMDHACLYAQANGYTAGGNQGVTIQSGTSAAVPTAPGINSAQYLATARVSQKIPRLFSAVLGNTILNLTARASAAITPAYTGTGCIYVLDPTDQNSFVASGSAIVTPPAESMWIPIIRKPCRLPVALVSPPA